MPEAQAPATTAAATASPEPAAVEEADDKAIWDSLGQAEADQARAESADKGDAPQVAEQTEDPPATDSKEPAAADENKPEAAPKAADIWANLSPEQRAELTRLQSRDESFTRMAGTVSGYQKKLDELQARIDGKAPAQPVTTSDKKDANTPAAQTADEVQAIFEDAAFKKAKEDYPEVFGPIESVLRATAAKLGRVEERLGGISQTQSQTQFERNDHYLEAKHPGWKQLVISDEFKTWKVAQPAYLRDRVDTTEDADELAHILRAYKLDNGIVATPNPSPTPAPAAAAPSKAPVTPAPNAKRAAQLESAAAPRAKSGAPAVTGIPEDGDPKEIWNALAREEKRQEAQHR